MLINHAGVPETTLNATLRAYQLISMVMVWVGGKTSAKQKMATAVGGPTAKTSRIIT